MTATKIDKAGIFRQKAVNVTSKAIFSGGDGFPRAQPRRGPETAFHQRRGLFGVRAGRWGNATNSPDAVVRLLFDAQPLASCRLARARWRSSRVHAASDQHAGETVEGASSRDRVRPSLSRALQVFSGGNRRLLLPGRWLRGAERPACQPRGASGIVALVEFAPCGARTPGVSHPLDVAFASPHRLAANCQPTTNGSRSGGVALLRQSRSAVRRS